MKKKTSSHMTERRKLKLMDVMAEHGFTNDELGETWLCLYAYESMLKGLIEAELVIKSQNNGCCPVSVLTALKKAEGK